MMTAADHLPRDTPLVWYARHQSSSPTTPSKGTSRQIRPHHSTNILPKDGLQFHSNRAAMLALQQGSAWTLHNLCITKCVRVWTIKGSRAAAIQMSSNRQTKFADRTTLTSPFVAHQCYTARCPHACDCVHTVAAYCNSLHPINAIASHLNLFSVGTYTARATTLNRPEEWCSWLMHRTVLVARKKEEKKKKDSTICPFGQHDL